jgi:hypothetical protein
VVVLAHLLQRTHEEPAHRLLDPPPVALEPVGHDRELSDQLAAVPGLFPDLTERGSGTGLTGTQRALGQRPHLTVTQIAGADEEYTALLVEDDTTG